MAGLADFFTFGGSQAAEQAGNIQAHAAQAGIPIQQQQLAQTTGAVSPFIGTGIAALGSLAALSGLGGPEAQEMAVGQIRESPAQQFIRERQQRALLRNASAIGGLGGGNIRSALQEQSAGFAIQDLENQRRALAGLAPVGLQAGLGLGALGATTAGNVAQLQQAEAAARASGILGAQQARASGIEDFAGVLATIFG